MWEYKRKDIKFRIYNELTDAVNVEGKDKWEIIFYEEEKPTSYSGEYTARILFKRLKPES